MTCPEKKTEVGWSMHTHAGKKGEMDLQQFWFLNVFNWA